MQSRIPTNYTEACKKIMRERERERERFNAHLIHALLALCLSITHCLTASNAANGQKNTKTSWKGATTTIEYSLFGWLCVAGKVQNDLARVQRCIIKKYSYDVIFFSDQSD